MAEVGVHRHGVGAQHAEDGAGVGFGRVAADVAALGVEDRKAPVGHVAEHAGQPGQPVGAERLEQKKALLGLKAAA